MSAKGKINSIEFGLMSPEMIRKLSVMTITTSDVYDVDGYPVEGGIMDPRLGVIDPGMVCRTCGNTYESCPGHFGLIVLAKPVVNVYYVKEIRDFLTYTCHECGSLLVSKDKVKYALEENVKIDMPKKCPNCSTMVEEIKFERPYTFYRGEHALTPEEIRQHLENISDEDAKVFGMENARPEWLVLTMLLVPPVSTRPSITLETGEKSEDDLTHKLVDIIRINKRLQDNLEIGAPENLIEDLWELLQYHVATYLNNELSGIPQARHRSGRALKTLAQRLKSKEGRFRYNLSGKRVNFSARTVVSPDPRIHPNEVGVPYEVAKELTIPIKVTEYNIEELRKLVRNGPDNYPGANYVITPRGIKKKILDSNKEIIAENLQVGDVVERHLMDGDVVLFNRQPSLHRMSVMAHKVRVLPAKTFRLNLVVTPPYNADFDGDEMNLHVPQTAEARAEAEQLMLVQENFRSPRFGGPILGAQQDYVSGAYLLSKEEKISKKDVVFMLSKIGKFDIDLDKEYYSGKEILSFIIPKSINIEFKSSTGEKVVIKDGVLIEGVLDEKAISAFKGKLIDVIDRVLGHKVAVDFLYDLTRLVLAYLNLRGFSMGTDDLEIPEEAEKKIQEVIDKYLTRAEEHIRAYKEGRITPTPGKNIEETLEDLIMQEMWNITNEVQEIIKKYAKDSEALVMAITGARGNIQNLAYMSGLVGQETIRGKRPSRGYRGRTLSHFKKGDLSPYARGFVRESFKKGLNPVSFFFEAMKGREGIMDSSLKTRVSGYLERRLVNALQDLKVDKDLSVRDDSGNIIQFVAGEDGIDPSKSDWGELIKGE